MIMHCQKHGFRMCASAVTRAVTSIQSEQEVLSCVQKGEIFSIIALRLFTSQSNSLHYRDQDATTKEILATQNGTEDGSDQHSTTQTQNYVSNSLTLLSDDEKHLEPALSAMMDEKTQPPSALRTISVVPGKGPPPEPPVTCCMSGCVNCVWIRYAEELRDYYSDGGEKARAAVEKIEDPSLRAFVKLELGL